MRDGGQARASRRAARMWPLTRKPIVDDDTAAWHIDNFVWLVGLQDGAMHGWRIGHSGYLPEPDLIFALALFIEAKAIDAGPALACLKPHLATMLRRTLRDFGRQPSMLATVRKAMAGADTDE